MNPIDTLADMITGLVIFFMLMGGYVTSLALRLRRARRTLAELPPSRDGE